MRQQAARLGLLFQDADLTLNKSLVDDEHKMFLDPAAENYRPIKAAIEKTKTDGHRYRTSIIDGHEAKFLPPYTFLVSPSADHPRSSQSKHLIRLLCLYDNAGEHFMPGADAADAPMARHLGVSKGLMFVFDPTKDSRLRRKLGDRTTNGYGMERQDIVLTEAVNRIREQSNRARSEKIPQPLVVILAKFDAWRGLIRGVGDRSSLVRDTTSKVLSLQMDEVEAISSACRNLLRDSCPEMVNAADSISDRVIYAPVAAAGWDMQKAPGSDLPTFRTANCEPYGVLLPLLFLLNKINPKLVTSLRGRSR